MSFAPSVGLALDAPSWLLALPAVLLLGLLLRRRGAGFGAARLGMLALLVVALSRPTLRAAGGSTRVLLADRSASVVAAEVDELLATLPEEASVLVLPWGDPSSSPLAEAIDRARLAVPGARRVLVISDGLDTGGGAVSAAARAAQVGIAIDVLAVSSRQRGPDAALAELAAPAAWRAGAVQELGVVTQANVSGTLRLELRAEGQPAVVRAVATGGGRQLTWFPVRVPRETGPWRIEARVQLEGDQRPANDRLATVVEVLPPPPVLIVGEGPEPVRLADRLGEIAGFATTVLGPRRLPGRLSALEAWPVIVLVDVPASALAHEQRALLEAAVADRGHGLLMSAGRSSFALGGWRGTELEALAPVRLEPAPTGRRGEVALLLMVDRSASMAGGDSRSRASKLDLAREAGLLAADALGPSDRIGALAYDDQARWLSAIALVGQPGERRELRRALGAVAPGGGTRILAALELGLPALAEQEAPTRHAVLLSDGRDDHGQAEAMAAAVRRARQAGVTLSVIAIGLDADQAVLQRLARLGGGRYHAARDPGDLPRLTAEESQMVRAGAEREGVVRPRRSELDGPSPLIAGVEVDALPDLSGYQALLPRPDADPVLESAEGDPLLSAWPYGRGRVAAWMADAGSAWASDWIAGDEGVGAWAQVVHRLAPEAGSGRLVAESVLVSQGQEARISARLSTRDGRPSSLADVTLSLLDAEPQPEIIALLEVAPGLYRRDVPLGDPVDGPLVRRAIVTARVDGDVGSALDGASAAQELSAALLIARGHAPESLPRGGGEALLREVAAASGGTMLESLPPAWRRRPQAERALWPWLLAGVTLAWPLDLAWRLRRSRPVAASPAGPPSDPESRGASR